MGFKDDSQQKVGEMLDSNLGPQDNSLNFGLLKKYFKQKKLSINGADTDTDTAE